MNNAGVAYGEQAPAGSTSRPQTLDSPGDSAFDDIGLGKAILLRRSALLVPLPSVRPLVVPLPATIHSFDVDMRCGGDSMAVGVWRSVLSWFPVRIGVRCSTLDARGKRLR